MSVQDKIAELERQVARKKALVNAKISLPKDTPDDVKAEVNAAITEALLRLASDETSQPAQDFTPDEVKILKLLANRAQSKTSAPQANTTNVVKQSAVDGEKVLGKVEKSPPISGQFVGREAEIMSLDAIPVRQRGKIGPMEKVKIIEEREDGLLHVLTAGGVRFNIQPEELNFDIESM